ESETDSEWFSDFLPKNIPGGTTISKLQFFFNSSLPPLRDLDHLPIFPFHRILRESDILIVDSLEDLESIDVKILNDCTSGYDSPESKPCFSTSLDLAIYAKSEPYSDSYETEAYCESEFKNPFLNDFS